jgi:hypothetical protein
MLNLPALPAQSILIQDIPLSGEADFVIGSNVTS